MGQKSTISHFSAKRVKKPWPKAELNVGPRCGPYLIVTVKPMIFLKVKYLINWILTGKSSSVYRGPNFDLA